MRTVIQRVSHARVRINGDEERNIGQGLLILLGIEEADSDEDIDWLCAKIARVRVFNDAGGVMNLSVMDISGELMVISQFTLHASTKKGNRPSYIKAAKPATALPLYEQFIKRLGSETGLKIICGSFGAHMEVSLLNDGPVTLWIDSKNRE